MASLIPKFVVDYVMKTDSVQKQIEAQVEQATEKVAEQTAKELQKSQTELYKTRNYVVTSTQGQGKEKNINAKLLQKEDPGLLWGLYSNAPGSVQCANRIIEAVLGGGYTIEPDTSVNARSRKKSDLKELVEFFDSPNPDDTIESLIKAGIENYLAYGNWYMEKVMTKRGNKLAELYNLNSSQMTILVDPEKRKNGVLEKVGYRRVIEGNKGIIYDLDEIIHTKRPSATAGVYGKAVLETNQAMLDLLIRAVRYNTSVLKNGGRPPIQIVLPEDTSEADAQAVSAFYETNFMGEGNAGKALILFKGAEAKPLGITPQDMAYLELIVNGIKLVSGQYGVPLFLIGYPEGSNRASASEGRRSFYYTNIYPLRKLIANKITKEVIQEGLGIEGWKFDFRAQGLEESESSRRDIMTAMGKGVMTWNEGRIRQGLLPIDDEWANKFYLVGSKNDSLMELKDAIGKEPDPENEDMEDIGDSTEPGEGADENSESETKPEED